MTASALLELRDISYAYHATAGAVQVLNRLNLNLAEQQWLAITGPSGAGKTTLLNLIAMLDIPEQGEIIFDGKNYAGISESEQNDFRRKHIGIVFQQHCLLPQCTAMENILLPTIASRIPAAEATRRANELLSAFNLESQGGRFPNHLSGGECQRVAVARALINRPRLLLADEPTGALDSTTTMELLEVLRQVNAAGTAIIMVTHSEIAAAAANSRCRLNNGKLL